MKLSYWRITGLVLVLFSFKFAQEQQVEISDFYAKVYLAPTTSSRFIGLAQKGETYTVVETRDAWLRIRFKNAVGWIQQAQTQAWDSGRICSKRCVIHPARPQLSSTTDSSPVSSVAGDTPKPTTPEIALKLRGHLNPKSSDSQAPAFFKAGKNRGRKPKRDLRLRNWFSQQNFLNNLPPNQDIDDQDVKYFQVTFGPARSSLSESDSLFLEWLKREMYFLL